MKSISQNIMLLRKQSNLSQTELAKKVGCSREIISKYEKEMVIPSVDIANKIADVFGVSLDYLVGNSTLILDKELVTKIAEIQQLPNEQLNIVNALLDAFLRDYNTKKAYSV